MQEAFDEICISLETDSELFTLNELRGTMVKAYGTDVYMVKQTKQKLQECYKENIFFTELSGQKNVVCLKDMAELIINNKWYPDRKSDQADEARKIIETTTKLIKCSIREDLNKQKETYLSFEAVKVDTQNLRAFLQCLIKSDMKI